MTDLSSQIIEVVGEFRVTNLSQPNDRVIQPKVAVFEGGFAIAFEKRGSLDRCVLELYTNEGERIAAPITVDLTDGGIENVNVVSLDDGTVRVGWTHMRSDLFYTQVYDLTGQPVGDREVMASLSLASGDVEWHDLPNGQFVTSWWEDGDGDFLNFRAANGNPIALTVLFEEEGARDVQAHALPNGMTLVTWSASEHPIYSYIDEVLMGQFFDAAGNGILGPFRMIEDQSGDSYMNHHVAVGNDGTILVSTGEYGAFPLIQAFSWVSPWQIAPVGDPFDSETIFGSRFAAFDIAPELVALEDGGFMAIWMRNVEEPKAILLDAQGQPESGVLSFSDLDERYWRNFESATKLSNGNVLVITNQANSATPDYFARILSDNDAPEGGITLTGTAEQGAVLEALPGFTDSDGIDEGSFSYAWFRNGTEIVGAVNAAYTLTQADVGSLIEVQLTYLDGDGVAAVLSSGATEPVANVNDAPTGGVGITGTPTQDSVLTADTSSLQDIDGLGSLAFQWLRDGAPIPGATGSSHVLTETDVFSVISVRVSYVDGQGTAEEVLSPDTAPITPPDLFLPGSPNDDVLTGGLGNDVLVGEAGNDELSGGGGNDLLRPGTGEDAVEGGDGRDTVDYSDTGAVTVRLFAERAGGDGIRDTLISVENIIGSAFDDLLTGDDADNVIEGGDGNDRLVALIGNDTVSGGDGADVVRGGRDNDRLDGNDGDDRIQGELGEDLLLGGTGEDFLFGGANEDTLNGGADDDLLSGGSHRDTFVFEQGSGFDRIIDWQDGTDVVDLTDFGFSDFSEVEAIARQVGAGVRLEFAGGEILQFSGMVRADLSADDVLLT